MALACETRCRIVWPQRLFSARKSEESPIFSFLSSEFPVSPLTNNQQEETRDIKPTRKNQLIFRQTLLGHDQALLCTGFQLLQITIWAQISLWNINKIIENLYISPFDRNFCWSFRVSEPKQIPNFKSTNEKQLIFKKKNKAWPKANFSTFETRKIILNDMLTLNRHCHNFNKNQRKQLIILDVEIEIDLLLFSTVSDILRHFTIGKMKLKAQRWNYMSFPSK